MALLGTAGYAFGAADTYLAYEVTTPPADPPAAAPADLAVDEGRYATWSPATGQTAANYEYRLGSDNYAPIPNPTVASGKIRFLVPGTVAAALSVRRRAVGAGVPGQASLVSVAAAGQPQLFDSTFQNAFTQNETTGWVADAEVQRLGAGAVRFQGPETRFLYQRVTLLAGRRYYVRVDISSYTSGGLDVSMVGANDEIDGLAPVARIQAVGTYTAIITSAVTRTDRFYLVTNPSTNLVAARFDLLLLAD